MEEITKQAVLLVTEFGVKFLAAAAILIFGRWFAVLIRKLLINITEKQNVEPTLAQFINNICYYALVTFVVIAALGQLGIETTSFIAVLGAAGLAIGFALQGSLSNFAAGFLIIIFRPIKAGDLIDAAGTEGIVESISLFTTILRTPDNKTIIIPNAKLTDDTITNYSTKGIRRIDFIFGVGYNDDLDKVRTVIEDVLSTDSRVLKDPEITIGVAELADSSVNFAVRPWVNADDYWAVFFNINEQMKKRFDAEGISIPYPQTDVHLHQAPGS
jgi:small conductance mechanosensitive channel